MSQTLFLTGMQRSGTTLLEKLLAARPAVSLLSQPFPLVFAELKAAFLRTLGAEDRYPLGHLFLEDRYSPATFAEFLERDFSRLQIDLREMFVRMEGYSGQYTRFERHRIDAALAAVETGGSSIKVLEDLYELLANRSGAVLRGGKETTCEEFLPAMLRAGWRCVLIIRDPRDVVTSLNHGGGAEFGGKIKPTLFNVRQWRKSVSFALELEGRPSFIWVRYEDLVSDPAGALSRIGEALELGDMDVSLPMLTERGEPWSGNSSHQRHRGVSDSSVGMHHHLLPREVRAFIEAACLPEMNLLGYDTEIDGASAPEVLSSFREPYTTRGDMEGDVAGPHNLELEIRRLEALRTGAADELRCFFPFESVWKRLRERE